MGEPKHTPGPWSVEISPVRHTLCVIAETAWICGELSNRDDIGSDEADANARLIAAAPDLYEALDAMVDRWEPDTEGSDRRMWEAARAALSKARGES